MTTAPKPRKTRTSVARIGNVVSLRRGLDLSGRMEAFTGRNKEDYIPAGIRGNVLDVCDESRQCYVEFPVMKLREWIKPSLLKQVK